ncbi:hypothetical protein DFP72DRAFT_852929 [Ephemerocybe angulata]|uniref:Uncharacterized protein n=1 Tax=Ephemerocybe angulata TaxID=980116 RepID=A0A8H6M0S1_9AGAR|nr:hypothetical protein DFP72DRAFT_852929 [Tulosesus angulatus]
MSNNSNNPQHHRRSALHGYVDPQGNFEPSPFGLAQPDAAQPPPDTAHPPSSSTSYLGGQVAPGSAYEYQHQGSTDEGAHAQYPAQQDIAPAQMPRAYQPETFEEHPSSAGLGYAPPPVQPLYTPQPVHPSYAQPPIPSQTYHQPSDYLQDPSSQHQHPAGQAGASSFGNLGFPPGRDAGYNSVSYQQSGQYQQSVHEGGTMTMGTSQPLSHFEQQESRDTLQVPSQLTRYLANPEPYMEQEFLSQEYQSYRRPPSRIPTPEPTQKNSLPRTGYMNIKYRRPVPAAADLDHLVTGFDRAANNDLKAYVEAFRSVTRFTQFSIALPQSQLADVASANEPGPSTFQHLPPPPGASIPLPQAHENINFDEPRNYRPTPSDITVTKALGKVETWRITSTFTDFVKNVTSVPCTSDVMAKKREDALDEGLQEALETITDNMVASHILAGVYLTSQSVRSYCEGLIDSSPEIAIIIAARYGIFVEPDTWQQQYAQFGYATLIPTAKQTEFKVLDGVRARVVNHTDDFVTHFRECINIFVADFGIRDRHMVPDVAHYIHCDGALRVSISLHGRCGSDLHRYNLKEKLEYESQFNWAWPELALPGEAAFNCFRWAIDIKEKGENSRFSVQLLRSPLLCSTLNMIVDHIAGLTPIALVRYLNRENPFIVEQMGPELDSFRYIPVMAYAAASVSSVFAAYERKGSRMNPMAMLDSNDIEDLFQNKLMCTLSFIKYKSLHGKPSEQADMIWLNGLCAFRGAEASYPSRWVEAFGDFTATFGPDDVDSTMPPSLRGDTISHIVRSHTNLNNSGGYYRRSMNLKQIETAKRHKQLPADMIPVMDQNADRTEPWVSPVSLGNFIAPPPVGYTFAVSHPFLPSYFQPIPKATANEEGITTHWSQVMRYTGTHATGQISEPSAEGPPSTSEAMEAMESG